MAIKNIVYPDMRADIVQTARIFAANKGGGHMHYTQDLAKRLAFEHLGQLVWPIETDCSGFFTMLYYVNGCLDPNKAGYRGWGNTATLITGGKQIPMAKVRPGDAVIYGAGGGDHVAIVVEVHGTNIMTLSHGQEGDPSYVWVNKPTGLILPQNQGVKAVDGRTPQRFFTYDTTKRRQKIALPPLKA